MRVDRLACRGTPRLEISRLFAQLIEPVSQVLDLLLVEGDLLLMAADLEFALMRLLPRLDGMPLGVSEFQPQGLEQRFELRHSRRNSSTMSPVSRAPRIASRSTD